MPNFTEAIKCPKCKETFNIQIEIDGRQYDDLTARITPLDKCPTCRGTGIMRYPHYPQSCPICEGSGRIKIEQQQTFEEWLQDKLSVLQSPVFYGSEPVLEEQRLRRKVIEALLQEYRDKKAKGWLKV